MALSGTAEAASVLGASASANGGAWPWASMQRAKTNGRYNTTLPNVDNVLINVCNYYPEKAPAG
ncbi:hypothetical protein ACIA98_16505 [Streptomyces sp. NPDC051366]|uniref:hypothetical protein n=1 Tax=Streptomyces sp. NPDC051366 TaxID=3365652 RepID=UPI00379310DC